MLKRVIPVLLLSKGGLVKTQKFGDPKYVGDPINAVRIFSEKEADELVFLDIDASKENRPPNFQLIHDISTEACMPFSYGGGIQTLEQAERVLKNGAEKIILNHISLSNPDLVKEMVSTFGSSSVVLCLDVKKTLLGGYKLFSHVQGKTLSQDLEKYFKRCEDLGFGEVVVQNVDLDGTLLGYDEKLIAQVRQWVSIPLIALGGAKDLNNIKTVLNLGVDGAAAGSFFTFHGKYRAVLLTYPSNDEMKEVIDASL